MAVSVARVRPWAPIMRMYIQVMGSTPAEPQRADATGRALSAPLAGVLLATLGVLGLRGWWRTRARA